MFVLISALRYFNLRSMLGHGPQASMNAYNDVVKLAPKQADLTKAAVMALPDLQGSSLLHGL